MVRKCLGCGKNGHRLESCKSKAAAEIRRLRAHLEQRHHVGAAPSHPTPLPIPTPKNEKCRNHCEFLHACTVLVPFSSRSVLLHCANKFKPTNPNADTYVEEQRQHFFVTFSSEPTCETPWVDTLRWHSCKTPLLDTIAQRSDKTLLLDTSSPKLLLDTLIRHSYSTLLTWHFSLDTLVRHSYLTLL